MVIVVMSATITGDEATHSDIYTDSNLLSWVFEVEGYILANLDRPKSPVSIRNVRNERCVWKPVILVLQGSFTHGFNDRWFFQRQL